MSTSSEDRIDFDLIVIGAGPVGENVADYATRGGLRTALIESELVGGECSYWACMPSKALLRSGHALRAARRVPGAREAITAGLDVEAIFARRDAFTSDWDDHGQEEWVASAGIELIRGHGRIVGPARVDVDGREYAARAVAIATGSVPVVPDVPGLADAAPWGTREATSADRVPPRLIVLGGGVAGTEMAFAYASFGSRVTVLARRTLLGGEEPFVGERIAAALTDEGVDVRLGATASRVERGSDGLVRATLSDGEEIVAEEILVATGRRPATDDLGLDAVDVDAAPTVDDTMLVTGTDWLYAVGDVNSRALLTHQGKYQARAAGSVIAARLNGATVSDQPWGAHVATADHGAVPRVVFSDPEVAAAGRTEADARSAGLNVRTAEFDLGSIAGASLHADGYAGRAKLVFDADRRVVVGAAFVGQDASELVHAATIAIVGEVPLERLWHAVPAYPTISEVWLRLLETFG